MDWTPTLADRAGPTYQRIVEALSADIAHGRLHRGQQLPTHRALAKALGVDLTTVTRAYTEARQRGLTEARVGQGTFVAEAGAAVRPADVAPPQFDLSMNLPPQPLEADLDGRLARGIASIEREGSLSACLNYREPGGLPDERDEAAAWLARRVPHARGERLVICPGTQNALFDFLSVQTSAGRCRAVRNADLSGAQGRGGAVRRAPRRRRDRRGGHPAGRARRPRAANMRRRRST